MSAAPFCLAFTTPLLLWAGARLGGVFVLLPVALIFVLLPVLDEDAPQLPAGYAAMLLLSLVPPLWFRVMDPRVRAGRSRNGGAAGSPA